MGTIRLALQLHNHANRVYVITDFTETGMAVREVISEATSELAGRVALESTPRT